MTNIVQFVPMSAATARANLKALLESTRPLLERCQSRIVRPKDIRGPVGNCGHYGFCGALAPVACYTCRNFQLWVDGPHEEVLEDLLAERDHIMRQTGDGIIAAVNDRVILACADLSAFVKPGK